MNSVKIIICIAYFIILIFQPVTADVTHLTSSEDSTFVSMKILKAKEFVHDYKLDSAILIYKDIYKNDRNNIDLLMELETLYSNTSQYDEALTCSRKILDLKPDDKHYLIRSGLLLKKMDEHKAALQIFKTALTNDNKNTFILSQIADIYRDVNNIDSACYYYSLACDIKPVTANLIKATDLFLKNKWNKGALYFIEKYYSPDVHKSNVLKRFYGRALYVNDSIPDAYNIFKDLYQNGDSSLVTTKFLGLCYWKAKYYTKATKVLESFVAKDSTDFLCYYVLGFCCNLDKENSKGLKYFNKALELLQPNPKTLAMVYQGLGEIYEWERDLHKAIEYYGLIYETDPENIYGEYKVATIYDFGIEDKKKALECYSKLVDLMEAQFPGKNSRMKIYCQMRIEKLTESEFWEQKEVSLKQ